MNLSVAVLGLLVGGQAREEFVLRAEEPIGVVFAHQGRLLAGRVGGDVLAVSASGFDTVLNGPLVVGANFLLTMPREGGVGTALLSGSAEKARVPVGGGFRVESGLAGLGQV